MRTWTSCSLRGTAPLPSSLHTCSTWPCSTSSARCGGGGWHTGSSETAGEQGRKATRGGEDEIGRGGRERGGGGSIGQGGRGAVPLLAAEESVWRRRQKKRVKRVKRVAAPLFLSLSSPPPFLFHCLSRCQAARVGRPGAPCRVQGQPGARHGLAATAQGNQRTGAGLPPFAPLLSAPLARSLANVGEPGLSHRQDEFARFARTQRALGKEEMKLNKLGQRRASRLLLLQPLVPHALPHPSAHCAGALPASSLLSRCLR